MNIEHPSEMFAQLTSSQVSRLLNLDENEREQWGRDDLTAMFRHQMDAPLQCDLATVPACEVECSRPETTITPAKAKRIQTFRELLFHSSPPLELLEYCKNFFKERTKQLRTGSQEWNLAYVFYLLSILVARKNGLQITALADVELLRGVRWSLKQPWLDRDTASILEETSVRLGGG